MANSNGKLIREIKQLIHCQIKIFHRILKVEAVHFIHFLFLFFSLAFHSFFTSFIGRIQQSHSFAHSVFPHYLCLFSLFCTLNWDKKPKTEDKNGRVFFAFIQIATRKINLCVCTMCMFLIILHVSREWQQWNGRMGGKPTQNQIQKNDFLYAAGICIYTKERFHYIFILCHRIVHHIVIFMWNFPLCFKKRVKINEKWERKRERDRERTEEMML